MLYETDEKIKDAGHLAHVLTQLLRDNEYEEAYDIYKNNIKDDSFQTATVYHLGSVICLELSKYCDDEEVQTYYQYIKKGYNCAKKGLKLEENNIGCAKVLCCVSTVYIIVI